MTIRDRIQDIAQEAALWRRELHRHPQTAYEEIFASDFVAEKLTAWGVLHERGWAGTGIVATIEGRTNKSGKAIGLRADMDALNIVECANKPWISEIDGKMHGCGHDGHTAMLLAAGQYLAETRDFDGMVYLIFQPAEEGGNGAVRMVEEGLFTKYPMDFVYGLHNWPWLPAGTIALCPGPIMAGVDEFKVVLTGQGGHAAMPHKTKDPIVAAANAILALQNFVSRELDPMGMAVISVTNVRAGTGSLNVIPGEAVIEGSVRTLYADVQRTLERRLVEIVNGIAAAYDVAATVEYNHGATPTINDQDAVAVCAAVATEILGDDHVDAHVTPAMTAEDFGAMLAEVPGCYIWLGQATGEDDHRCDYGLHTPHYDFNDDVIALGTEYWVRLSETVLCPLG